MSNEHLWQKASAFAARAHCNQVRKDERTPYFSHPVRVALTVSLTFGCPDENVVAAALLHDVIEDTTADYDDILEQFGPKVADIVACMSKDMRMIEPKREREYDDRLIAGSWEAKLIKLADVYDNYSDAEDEGSRRKFVEKARRAVEIAGGEPKVAHAVELLKALVARTATL